MVTAGAAQASGIPGVLDLEQLEWNEGHSRCLVQLLDECAEPGPLAVQAVARERPSAVEQVPITIADDPSRRSEHRGVALIGIREDHLRRLLRQVPGEEVAAGTDHGAPCRAAVDGGQPLERVHRLGDGCLDPSQLVWDGEAMDPRVPQRRHDTVREPSATLDLLDRAGDDFEQRLDGWRLLTGGRLVRRRGHDRKYPALVGDERCVV